MPPHEPSVLGCVHASAAEDLQRLIEAGALGLDHLEARLPQRDLELLETKPEADAWVPVDAYGRILDLLAEARGEAPEPFHRARGIREAERLVASGFAAEPAVVGAGSAGSPERWHAPLGRCVLASQQDLYSFMTWSFEAGARRHGFTFVLEDAAALPRGAQLALEGLVAYLAAYLLDAPFDVRSRRPAPDRVRIEGRGR